MHSHTVFIRCAYTQAWQGVPSASAPDAQQIPGHVYKTAHLTLYGTSDQHLHAMWEHAGLASSVEPATPHPATSPAGHQPMNMKKRLRWGDGCLLDQKHRSASTAHYGLLRPQTTGSSGTAYLPTTEMPSSSRVSRSLAPVAPPEHPVLSLETPQLRLHAQPHPIIFTRR